MDLASHVARWKSHAPDQWARTANRIFPPGLTFVLVIALAYQFAVLTWTVVPGAPHLARGVPVMPEGSQPSLGRSTDLTSLIGSNLFGPKAVAPVAEAVIDAPDTTLSLRLRGTRTVLEGELADQAIIERDGDQQRTYELGQLIEGASGATLQAVYPDRVILNRDGRLETLRWPEGLSNDSSRASPRAIGAVPPSAETAGSLRQVISENGARLTDIIRPALHVQEGQVVGFRVSPGRDRAAFDALGLRPGDVVTDINGTVLDDAREGLRLFESLGESTQASVTVLRDGVPQVIVIDASRLQGLQQN